LHLVTFDLAENILLTRRCVTVRLCASGQSANGQRTATAAEQQQPAVLRDRGHGRRAPADNRQSRDDFELIYPAATGPVGSLPARPRPGPRIPPRIPINYSPCGGLPPNSYDLNALSTTVSVRDTVHYYQNIADTRLARPAYVTLTHTLARLSTPAQRSAGVGTTAPADPVAAGPII